MDPGFVPQLKPGAAVVPYVLLDVAMILAAARLVGTVFERSASPASWARSSPAS